MSQVKPYKITQVENAIFDNSSPEVRKTIVEIGCSVYTNLKCITHVQTGHDEEQVQERIDIAFRTKNKIIEDLSKQLDEFQSNKDAHTQHLVDEIESLKCEHAHAYSIFQTQKDADMKRFDENNNSMVQLLQSRIRDLESINGIHKAELDKIEKSRTKNSVEAGIVGEQSIIDYLGKTFQEGALVNTTKKGAHGDVHFNYQNTDILIEVKNKDTISLEDVNKFKRDILETKCDGAIFVSIKTGVNIPCHSMYDIEWLNDVPIMYITNFDVCPITLYGSIKTIHFYSKRIHSIVKSDDVEAEQKKKEFEDMMEIVRCFSYSLEDLLGDTQRITSRLTRLQTMIKEKIDLKLGSDNMSYMDQIMALFKSHTRLANGGLPTEGYLIDHGITRGTVKQLGGMSELKKKFQALP